MLLILIVPSVKWKLKPPFIFLLFEPVCLGVLRELNARLSNRINQNMFGWAKFVGLRFWISRFSRSRKRNFSLRFRYRAICKSWFHQYFLLKTKNSLQSSPFTVASPVLSLHHIYQWSQYRYRNTAISYRFLYRSLPGCTSKTRKKIGYWMVKEKQENWKLSDLQ